MDADVASKQSSSPKVLRVLKRVVIGTGAVALFGTAFMGALHTKWGRPLMAKMGMGCPINKATPEQVEKMRQTGMATMAAGAQTAAPARPAFGFKLDVTTRDEVVAWGESKHLDCEIKKRGSDAVFCKNVPRDIVSESAGPEKVDELDFMFNPAGKLVQIETMRRGLSGADAEALLTGMIDKLTPVLGQPTTHLGERTAEYFTANALLPYQAKYVYSDYVVILNGMRFDRGVAVRERYLSASAATPPS